MRSRAGLGENLGFPGKPGDFAGECGDMVVEAEVLVDSEHGLNGGQVVAGASGGGLEGLEVVEGAFGFALRIAQLGGFDPAGQGGGGCRRRAF